MKFIAVEWYTGRTCVGIVKAENSEGEVKYLIGSVGGMDEETDIQTLLDWGTAFSEVAGDALFP